MYEALHFGLVLFEHAHVLGLVLLRVVEHPDVLLHKDSLHIFEGLRYDDVLESTHHPIEVRFVWVTL